MTSKCEQTTNHVERSQPPFTVTTLWKLPNVLTLSLRVTKMEFADKLPIAQTSKYKDINCVHLPHLVIGHAFFYHSTRYMYTYTKYDVCRTYLEKMEVNNYWTPCMQIIQISEWISSGHKGNCEMPLVNCDVYSRTHNYSNPKLNVFYGRCFMNQNGKSCIFETICYSDIYLIDNVHLMMI